MDQGFKALLKSQLSAIVRAGLYIIGGILLRKGYITHDMSDTEANQLAGFIIGGGSLGWALVDNYRKHRETETALALPPGASRDDLKQKMREAKTLG